MEEGWRGFSRNEYGDFTLQILIFSSRLHSWLVTWVQYTWSGSKRLGDFDKHVIFNVAVTNGEWFTVWHWWVESMDFTALAVWWPVWTWCAEPIWDSKNTSWCILPWILKNSGPIFQKYSCLERKNIAKVGTWYMRVVPASLIRYNGCIDAYEWIHDPASIWIYQCLCLIGYMSHSYPIISHWVLSFSVVRPWQKVLKPMVTWAA